MEIEFDGVRPLARRQAADLEQAGAIVVRESGDEPQLLVITNKAKDRWLFPKGTIRKGESPEEAAQREALEEAGVEGELLAYVGATLAEEDDERVRVNYYLLRELARGDAEDDRVVRWCAAAEAIELLSSPALRELMKKALPEIMEFV